MLLKWLTASGGFDHESCPLNHALAYFITCCLKSLPGPMAQSLIYKQTFHFMTC